jgi:hypothetical protein
MKWVRKNVETLTTRWSGFGEDKMNAVSVAMTRRWPAALLEKTLLVLALSLIVFASKILFIRYFGSALPYWDQWDAEADSLYKAYLNSGLTLSALFSAHNEHRIFMSRLLSLALFELDGGWDPILQMIVNAALHTVAIVLLALTLQRILRPAQFVSLVVFTAFLFVLPLGWENLLAGFQSQFYMLLIFSFLALAGFAAAPALSARWWLSVMFWLAAFLSMASGALIGVAALGLVVLQLTQRVRMGAREYVGAVLLLGISAVMIAYVPRVAGHDSLKAHSLDELLRALFACLNYPRPVSYKGLLMNLPLLAYAVFVVTTRPARTSPHWVVLSIIVWWLGQILSLSYGRAVAPNSSRYVDLTIVAMPVNFAILLFALRRVSIRWQQLGVALATVVWLAVTLAGLIFYGSHSEFTNVAEKAAQSREQEANVKEYLRAGNTAVLQNKPLLAIPYPSPERLAMLLSDPTIRMALPRLVRPADVSDEALRNRTVLKGRFRAWLQRVIAIVTNYAPAMLGLGLALALAATFFRAAGKGESEIAAPANMPARRP